MNIYNNCTVSELQHFVIEPLILSEGGENNRNFHISSHIAIHVIGKSL